MCPDRELLSAWIDGEVPSPWSEAIERHLDGCASCAEAARSLRLVGERLRADEAAIDGAARAASERVYGRVAPSLRPSAVRSVPKASSAVWARRLAVPIPAAAAAALVLAAMAFALVASGRRNAEMRMAMQRAYEATPVAAAGIESVIDFLSQQNSAVNINITLPPEAFGGTAGEPFIVREADYRGGSGR